MLGAKTLSLDKILRHIASKVIAIMAMPLGLTASLMKK